MSIRLFIPAIFFISATSGFSQITNQRLFDTVGFMADHYAKRTALFKAQPIKPGSIVFLGNSITEGGNWKELTGDSTVVNRGIGGDITFGVLKRLDEIIYSRPSKLFLLIGINDIGKDIPDAVIADNIRKIIERFQKASPATTLYIHSILPVNPTVKNFPQHYDKNEHVTRTNALIRNVVKQHKSIFYVDINKVFADAQGYLSAQYTGDGLHLNAAGYQLWMQHLKSLKAF